MSDLKAQIHMYMDAIPCVELSVAQELIHERNELREALQSVMDWNPKPEYWERPETVARFEADMARARKVLQEAQETKPHQKWWEVLEETE